MSDGTVYKGEWKDGKQHGRWDVKDAAARILKNIKEFKPMGVGMERGHRSLYLYLFQSYHV